MSSDQLARARRYILRQSMRPRVYVLTGSHPCAAVEAALQLKSIDYDRVELLPLTQLAVGPLRYGGITVPGMRLGGERVVGSRAIMRRLDVLAPRPALLPARSDPDYAEVLEAERWGDEVLQGAARRIINAAFVRRPAVMESYVEDARVRLPKSLMRPAMPPVARLMALRNEAVDNAVRADLAALPRQLERIDSWISAGVLGGEQPNAADLQIGSTIRLLLTIADVRPLIDQHPAAELTRYFPPIAGAIEPGVLPADWLTAAAAAPTSRAEPDAERWRT